MSETCYKSNVRTERNIKDGLMYTLWGNEDLWYYCNFLLKCFNLKLIMYEAIAGVLGNEVECKTLKVCPIPIMKKLIDW